MSALSPAADTGYFAFRDGVLRTRLADGATLEKVVLPAASTRLTVIPGGALLLAHSATHVHLVQLDEPVLAAVPQRSPVVVRLAWVRVKVMSGPR